MHPKIATAENHIATARLRNKIGNRRLAFLWILPAFIYAKTGNTKSSGVNPIAPQIATKSPKKGIAAATSVIRLMYTEVSTNRRKYIRRGKRAFVLLDNTPSSK